jgi:hypothetical protein
MMSLYTVWPPFLLMTDMTLYNPFLPPSPPLCPFPNRYLVVTNQTAIATSLHTWLDSFGVDDVSKLTGGKKTHTAGAAPKISGAGPSGTFSVQTGLPGKPGAPSQMAASTVGTQRGGGGHTASSRASPEPPIGTASVVTGHQGAGDAHSHYGPLSIGEDGNILQMVVCHKAVYHAQVILSAPACVLLTCGSGITQHNHSSFSGMC